MTQTSIPRRASRLRTGDRIVCRGDGAVERVVWNRPSPGGRRAVRTDRHDHYFRAEEGVEVQP